MQGQFKLLVTASEIGLVVETTEKNAAAAIGEAREFLTLLGATPATGGAGAGKKHAARSLSERIVNLGTAFFSEPKDATEISSGLARAAYHYAPVRVRSELQRLVQRGLLRRVGDGTRKAPFRYVNP
jgi:hypothetical protein